MVGLMKYLLMLMFIFVFSTGMICVDNTCIENRYLDQYVFKYADGVLYYAEKVDYYSDCSGNYYFSEDMTNEEISNMIESMCRKEYNWSSTIPGEIMMLLFK